MSAFKPVSMLSPKGLQVLSQLAPSDEVLVRRNGQFYALGTDAFFEETPTLTGEVFFRWDGSLNPTFRLGPVPTPQVDWRVRTALEPLPEIPTAPPAHTSPIFDMRDGKRDTPSWKCGEFVQGLEVLVFQPDYRHAYIDWASRPSEPSLRAKPQSPQLPVEHPLYQPQYLLYRDDLKRWEAEEKIYRSESITYPHRLRQWFSNNDPDKIVADGSHRAETRVARVTGRSITRVQQTLGTSVGRENDDLVALLIGTVQELQHALNDTTRRLRVLEQKVR